MKRFYLWLFLGLLSLQSCSIDTTLTFHKDKTRSIAMEIDTKEFFNFTKDLPKDSTKGKVEKNKFFEEMPQDWTSIYDMEARYGKKGLTTHPDSVRMMKKTFLKGKFQDKQLIGMGLRIDHISDKDHQFFAKSQSEKDSIASKYFVGLDDIFQWNGKKLIFYPKKWISKSDKEQKKKDNQMPFGMDELFKMKVYIKFDTPIKSVRDGQKLAQKIDEKTIVIDINSLEKELKNKNPKIVIHTE